VASAKSKFWLPRGLHQFRTRNRRHQNTTNMINPQRKQIKINEADRYPPAYSGLVAGTSSVRTNNEINSSEPCLRSRWTLAPSIGEVPSSSERAACIAPNAKKIDNRKPRAASFLFVRRGTQSYDEFMAAVPLRPRLSMMLGMINTSDILSIGENASARISSGRTSTTR
jgi:hypothetical protein